DRVGLARTRCGDLALPAAGARRREHRNAAVCAPDGGLVTGQALREKGLSYLIVGPFAIVLAFPFYVMVITAFKNQSEFYDTSVTPYWFGKKSPTWVNASFLFYHTAYPTWLENTAIVGVCVVAITLLLALPAGY